MAYQVEPDDAGQVVDEQLHGGAGDPLGSATRPDEYFSLDDLTHAALILRLYDAGRSDNRRLLTIVNC